nr:hypothetical protein [Tanacetum cinerariifolium]
GVGRHFNGVGNVTVRAADCDRRKGVKFYVQCSRRRKRKKVIARGSGSPDSTKISC